MSGSDPSQKPSELERCWNKLPSWAQILLAWTVIGFGVLLTGGAALRALAALRDLKVSFGWGSFWGPLLLFAAGAGIAIGLLILTWWMVTRRGFSWTLGFVILGAVLFVLFVWPTRYAYWEKRDKDNKLELLLKVERLTGKGTPLEVKKEENEKYKAKQTVEGSAPR